MKYLLFKVKIFLLLEFFSQIQIIVYVYNVCICAAVCTYIYTHTLYIHMIHLFIYIIYILFILYIYKEKVVTIALSSFMDSRFALHFFLGVFSDICASL